MDQESIDWVLIDSAYGRPIKIGAIGFIGDKAVVVVSFYADADKDQDGKISTAERFGKYMPIVGSLFFKEGSAITEVVMSARGDPDVMLRDSTFKDEAAKMFLDFGTSLVFAGLYTVYFSRAVSSLAGQFAHGMTDSVVKEYVIRKGMEKLVSSAYTSAVKTGTAFR